MSDSEKSKIIIDEDWKSQVQTEKKEAQQQRTGEEPADASQAEDHPLPPADFQTIVSLLPLVILASPGTVLPQSSAHWWLIAGLALGTATVGGNHIPPGGNFSE